MDVNIERFIEAQKADYSLALEEIRRGYKKSHWMWYIFPQIHGLGCSSMAKYYEIKSINEAVEFLNNEYLYNNLVNICIELLKLDYTSVHIFGDIDSIKLKSSMTLFNYLMNNSVQEKLKSKITFKVTMIFEQVLEKFYFGELDYNTLEILENELSCIK